MNRSKHILALTAFVQASYNVALEEHAFWDIFSEHDGFYTTGKELFTTTLLSRYPQYVKEAPELAPLVDELFAALLQESITPATFSFYKVEHVKTLFSTWTQYGTRDIPDIYIKALTLPLNKAFEYNERGVVNIVCTSAALWRVFEKSILDIFNDPLNPQCRNKMYKLAVFRNAPERAAVIPNLNTKQMYGMMCGASESVKPTLLNMRKVLIGPHNNALAWHTALAVCAPEDPTIVGSWMKMSETFSSLRFDPKDQDAWRFWHLLRECVKDDASGQELLSCLAETKHEMASAFADAWSIVDALYDGDARYERAAYIVRDTQALPTGLVFEGTLALQ